MLDQAQNDKSNSNTTLVKVKYKQIKIQHNKKQNSNTTLVKVKYFYRTFKGFFHLYSNTTLVKVKSTHAQAISNYPKFKYNTC